MGLLLRHSDPPWRMRREAIVLREAETDERYGKRPGDRSIGELLRAGYINVDKHVGPTSHEVAARVRGILGIDEAGHGGTLGRPSGDIQPCRVSSPSS